MLECGLVASSVGLTVVVLVDDLDVAMVASMAAWLVDEPAVLLG